MDLTGRKRRIQQLEESLADKERLTNIQQLGWKETEAKLTAAKNQIEYLVRTIHDMDQVIWDIGQQTSWEGMRPYYTKIQEGTIARKHAESNRIGDILRGELIDAYAPSAAKRIGKS